MKIDKYDLPDSSIKTTEKYTIAEFEHYTLFNNNLLSLRKIYRCRLIFFVLKWAINIHWLSNIRIGFARSCKEGVL